MQTHIKDSASRFKLLQGTRTFLFMIAIDPHLTEDWIRFPVSRLHTDAQRVTMELQLQPMLDRYRQPRSKPQSGWRCVLCHNADYFLDLLGNIAYSLLRASVSEAGGPRDESIQPAIAKVDT